MPRFYFDVTTTSAQGRGGTIEDLPGRQEVRDHAWELLIGLAQERSIDGDDHDFSVEVRDAEGERVHSARLTLRGRWTSAA